MPSGIHNRKRRGRPCHIRVRYLPGHPKAHTKQRIVRAANHHTLPNFIGRYFAPRDDPDEYPMYCASMLMLLKPWRCLETDLKQPSQNWESAFADFLSTAPVETKKILSGIQYFHECRASAMRQTMSVEMVHTLEGMELLPEDGVNDEGHEGERQAMLTEETLTDLVASQQTTREEWHGLLAIEAAKIAKIFDGSESDLWNNIVGSNTTEIGTMQLGMHSVRMTTAENLRNLLLWKEQMTEDVQKQNPAMDTAHTTLDNPATHGDVEMMPSGEVPKPNSATVRYLGDTETSEESLTAVDPTSLRYDQFRAYDIITAHLDATLAGQVPPPLRMLIHGEPGTGKSKAIQTATEHFIHRGARFMLQKSAYTGIAASLIDGKTTHTIAMISPRKDQSVSAESKGKLQAHWKHIQYLVIDEVSMISKSFLAKLSRNISIGKMEDGIQTSRTIFEEFTTVVTLKEQMRVTDPVWQDFLQHLRVGQVQERHIAMLWTLVLTNPKCVETDFSSPPWNNASLVTPRHRVHRIWNDVALRKHGQEAQSIILECQAEDTIKGQPLTLRE
ncbi:hypothetical protein SCLCIDRAFT_123270 [Scleroderma citrinum Foug A]|uniref:ATP-dependent DNA helicase n=1 Tax=Scleroderma citrinum Foug A TaxID=1036808 RepID=A0A0C3DJR7_9AGAM|nr:hypothetical protein SCLCIDRAFT_123270 [Scleroderma citrinum Foug A]